MRIVEQFQCPTCFELHDERHDARSCCLPQALRVFAISKNEYWSTETEAREHFYLKALQEGKDPYTAREIANEYEVVYA